MLLVLSRNILKLQIISILILLANSSFFSQQSKLSKSVNSITSYIASNHFNNLKAEIGDLFSTDSIYNFALSECDDNYGDALLSLMLATVPYREVPIQVPIINSIWYYPLVSSDEETFLKKNDQLPTQLFFDSPNNKYGDKDKLAHFFGSAFLSYESNIFDLGNLIGYFVEVFEESFKVQSSVDPRDLDVNYYGRIFGEALKENKEILPSQILLLRSIRYLRITI
jgi:hypothetical protein